MGEVVPAKNIREKRKCRKKIQYLTREAAEAVVNGLYAKRRARQPGSILPQLPIINAYQCKFCGLWHVGNRLKKRFK
jgi:hypothetical protein